MKTAVITPKSDWIGIAGSLGCLLHCAVLPALVYGLQLTASVQDHGHWLDYGFALVAIGAVGYAARRTDSVLIRTWLLASLALFVGGILLEHTFARAAWLLHTGTLGLVVGHALNLRRHYAHVVARH